MNAQFILKPKIVIKSISKNNDFFLGLEIFKWILLCSPSADNRNTSIVSLCSRHFVRVHKSKIYSRVNRTLYRQWLSMLQTGKPKVMGPSSLKAKMLTSHLRSAALSILNMLNINTEQNEARTVEDNIPYWNMDNSENTILLQAENTDSNDTKDSLPQNKHSDCFCTVYLSCSNTFWKPSKHLLLETCFSAMVC